MKKKIILILFLVVSLLNAHAQCNNSFVQIFTGMAGAGASGSLTVSKASIFKANDNKHFFVTGLRNDSTTISYFDQNGTRIWTDVFSSDSSRKYQIIDLYSEPLTNKIYFISNDFIYGAVYKYDIVLHKIDWVYHLNIDGHYLHNIHNLNSTDLIVSATKYTGATNDRTSSFKINKVSGFGSSTSYTLDYYSRNGNYYSALKNNILYGTCRRYNGFGSDLRVGLFAHDANTGTPLWSKMIVSNNFNSSGNTRMYPVTPVLDKDSLVVAASGQMNGFDGPLQSGQYGQVVLCKTSDTGHVIWTREYYTVSAGVNYDHHVTNALVNSKDGYYIVGNLASNVSPFNYFRGTIIKTDKNGKTKWARQIGLGATANNINNLIEMNGNIFIAVSSTSYNTTPDLVLIKLDSLGNSDSCSLVQNLPVADTLLPNIETNYLETGITQVNDCSQPLYVNHPINPELVVKCGGCCPLNITMLHSGINASYCLGDTVKITPIINGAAAPAGGFTYNWYAISATIWTPISTSNVYTKPTTVSANYTIGLVVTSLSGLCKDTIITDYVVNVSYSDTTKIVSCSPITWRGNVYNTSGIYIKNLTNSNGCDSTLILDYKNTNGDSVNNITYTPSDTVGSCCYNLTLLNNYFKANIGTISFNGIGSTQFAVSTTGAGWSYSGISSPSFREVSALPIGVDTGIYDNILKICITSTAPGPYKIEVIYKDILGNVLCPDTLEFDQCDVVQANCVTISNDSLYCEGNQKILKLNLTNNSPFPIREIAYFVTNNGKIKLDRDLDSFSLGNAILPGQSSGDIFLNVDTIGTGDTSFCLQVSAFDKIHTNTSAPTTCCSDSATYCFPYEYCTLNGCCEFSNMIIPNGITPNADGKNDAWVILAPSKCDTIQIEIFNRWGNKVYSDAHYLNTWKGTNQAGDKLPQGTYFVKIELPCGSKKGMYIDLRY
jgi:gliding motility-associated-like protein